MNNLTYKELHQQLMYNPWTGLFYRKNSDCKKINFGDIAGSKQHGYIDICINRKKRKAHRLAWFYVYGYDPENTIDHIDNLPEHRHHNWISNLREVSRQCQSRNQGNRKNNTSGVKGITWNKLKKKWQSQITVKGKTKGLGTYEDFNDAVCARLAGEQCLNWSECDSNSSAYLYVKEHIS